MTVSSTSETTPKRASGSIMRTGASTGTLSSLCSVTVAQPGARSASTTVSMKPPRSQRISQVRPPASMRTGASPTDTAVNERQPRSFLSRLAGFGSIRASSTRPRTRTQPGFLAVGHAPYPV
jgi:hypothetical protein